jgi:hypothetical protein
MIVHACRLWERLRSSQLKKGRRDYEEPTVIGGIMGQTITGARQNNRGNLNDRGNEAFIYVGLDILEHIKTIGSLQILRLFG